MTPQGFIVLSCQFTIFKLPVQHHSQEICLLSHQGSLACRLMASMFQGHSFSCPLCGSIPLDNQNCSFIGGGTSALQVEVVQKRLKQDILRGLVLHELLLYKLRQPMDHQSPQMMRLFASLYTLLTLVSPFLQCFFCDAMKLRPILVCCSPVVLLSASVLCTCCSCTHCEVCENYVY